MLQWKVNSAVSGALKIDTSWSGMILVKDGASLAEAHFGDKVIFSFPDQIIQGTLEGVSEDGFNLILDGREINMNAPLVFFAVIG